MNAADAFPEDLPPEARRTLVHAARHRARQHPSRQLFTFLDDGEHTSGSLTFAELDQDAGRIAAGLARVGARGERVLLSYPSGIEFISAFFGCLYAGAVAVPTVPPLGGRALRMIEAIARDAEPVAVLTQRPFAEPIAQQLGASPPAVLCGEDLQGPADASPPFEAGVAGEDLAMLQYTSGSTGSPRGVMLTHANLMHNQAVIWRHFAHSSSSIVAGWLPMFHDMGLIGTVMQPLYMGRPCVLMDPMRFIERPVRWLRAITRYGATTSGAPNFAYDMCVDRIPESEREGLDLRTWDLAFNGAEPIRAATLKRFAAAFGPHGFRPEAAYPCYGLAEAALMVSGGPKSRGGIVRHVHAADLEQHQVRDVEPGTPEGRALVSCGTPPADARVLAVDPGTCRPLPEGEVGEIWVSGPSVALGYWRRLEESRETFEARTPDGGKYLRTGDLGFLRDGMVWVTGRLKDLLIVHGRNHYPHEIEHTAESSHPALRPTGSAAFLLEGERQERLALVLEVAGPHIRSLDARQVAGAVRAAVSREHGLHVAVVALVRSGAVPKTSSGKVRRRACREALERGELSLLELDAIGWTAKVPRAGDSG